MSIQAERKGGSQMIVQEVIEKDAIIKDRNSGTTFKVSVICRIYITRERTIEYDFTYVLPSACSPSEKASKAVFVPLGGSFKEAMNLLYDILREDIYKEGDIRLLYLAIRN